MERSTHLKRENPLRSASLASLSRLFHRGWIARNNGLIGRVQIRWYSNGVCTRCLAAGGIHFTRGETQHRAHGPRTLGTGLVHQLPPAAHQAGAIFRAERLSSYVGAVFSQTVACCRLERRRQALANDGPDGRGVSEDRRLRVVGEGKLFLGSFPHQTRKRRPQGVINPLEDLARGREAFCQVLPHPDLLRPLPRTEQNDHHRMTALPQVNPAPKATSITSIPGFNRPSCSAWASASGMDAEDVFP